MQFIGRMSRLAGLGLLSVLLFLRTAAVAQTESNMPLYQLHGSGTSNPAPLIWRVLDIMMARTKPKIAMSYRSVGSGVGAREFTEGVSAFGCGDVPLPKSNFANLTNQNVIVMHVPILVGSVSVFYNVPGLGAGLYLSPCTLAKVFNGGINVWNHQDILNDNPDMKDQLQSLEQKITIIHRNNGSSSTYALTHYINKTCPQNWDRTDVGVTVKTWPAGSVEVENSQGMLTGLAANLYSIGYVESGQGLNAGFKELRLLNQNNRTLTSEDAEVASLDFIQSLFPSELTSEAWIDVNPVYYIPPGDGVELDKLWPMTLGTYLYVRTNLTSLNQTAGLLREFVLLMLSSEVAGFMKDYSFMALPEEIRSNLRTQVTTLLADTFGPAATVNWTTEGNTMAVVGQGNYVISKKRDSYLVSAVTGLVTDSAEAKRTLMLGDAYQVHGSGSFLPAKMIRHAMQILQGRARVPISLTYRAIGSVVAQQEFEDYRNMYKSYNHFKVSDMPLKGGIWTSLTANSEFNATASSILQLPLGISGLAFYYNKALPGASLTLDCGLVARIYKGEVTSWDDSRLADLNGFDTSDKRAGGLLAQKMVVYQMAEPSGQNWALTGFLKQGCDSIWTKDWSDTIVPGPGVQTSYLGVNISTPEQMLEAISGTPNSIGYLPATIGAASGLSEALLKVDWRQEPISVQEANLTVIAETINDKLKNVTLNVDKELGSGLFNLKGTWPAPMVPYFLMYSNLTGYGYSGPLLRAFAEFLLGDEGADLAASSGLTPLLNDTRLTLKNSVNSNVRLKTLTVAWDSEAAGLSHSEVGAGLYTFSANRQSYGTDVLAELQRNVAALAAQMEAAAPLVARVAVTPGGLPYMRLLRTDAEAMASSPIRVVSQFSSSAAAALGPAVAEPRSSDHPLAAINDGPLSQDEWKNLSTYMPVVQVPISIRPVALVYKGPRGLRLSVCTLGKIFRERINWNDGSIQADNPGLTLPAQPIRLFMEGYGDADARAVVQYVRGAAGSAGCSEYSNLEVPVGQDAESPLTGVVNAGQYSGLGVVPASSLLSRAASELQPVLLPSAVSRTYVSPLQAGAYVDDRNCPSTGCAGAVAATYTEALEELLGRASNDALGVPTDPLGDWSNFKTTPSGGLQLSKADVYPVFRLDFIIFPADVSAHGDSGTLTLALANYSVSSSLASRTSAALGPFFAGLGPSALQRLTKPGLDVASVLTPSATGTQWAVLQSSTDQASTDGSINVLTLSQRPPASTAALPGSDATQLAVTDDAVAALKSQLASAQQQAASAQDKADLAYGIAVAAIVLAIVLPLILLVVLAVAISRVRRGVGMMASSCLNPTAAKYEPQRDLHPGDTAIELQVQQQ